MQSSASFRQILEQKLRSEGLSQQAAVSTPSSKVHSTDPAHLAYLLGNVGVTYLQPRATRIYPAGPRPAPRPHELSPDQQRAFDFFNSFPALGPTLTAAFTRRDLKKAFRQLALRLHPDMNKGAVAPFLDLKNNYQSLSSVFKPAA